MNRWPKACAIPGCPATTRTRFCSTHRAARQRAYDQQRGSSTARGYDFAWQRRRIQILEAAALRCSEPECRALATEVDHRVPRRLGGSDDPANLVPLCKFHHAQKTARRDGRWGPS